MRRLVAELPEPCREAIVLREMNDLSYKEITEVADVPVGTVMSRLVQARAMLRSAWNAVETATVRPGSPTAPGIAAMKCAAFEVLLHALIDRELDAGHAREEEAHAARGSACAQKLASFPALGEASAGAALKGVSPARRRKLVEALLAPPASGG